MKRLTECLSELEDVNHKRLKLMEELRALYDKAVEDRLHEASLEATLFVKTIQENKSIVIRNNEIPGYSVAHTAVPGGLQLTGVFSIKEIAYMVLKDLAPSEMYLLSRVSTEYRAIVEDAFIVLASHYFDRFGEDLYRDDHLRAFGHSKTQCMQLIEMYKNRRPLTFGPLEALLSLWNHSMNVYRQYRVVQLNDAFHVDYTFVYDEKKGRMMRLRELNLFEMSNYGRVVKDFRDEWRNTYRTMHYNIGPSVDSLFLLGYDELCKLEFSRVKNIVFTCATVLIEPSGGVRRFSTRDFSFRCYAPPPRPELISTKDDRTPGSLRESTRPYSNGAPFFDYYEQRLSLSGATPYFYVELLELHYRRVMDLFCS